MNEKNLMKGLRGAVRSKTVIALVLSLLIIAILFYSSPVAAYWIDSAIAPFVSHKSGDSKINVTITIGKLSDELFNYSSVTAKLLYQDSSTSAAVGATNCSLLTSSTSYGYLFHGYGYGYDYSNGNGIGYGYMSGYGAGETTMSCMFEFDIKNGGVAVGASEISVNGIPLSNSSSSIVGAPYILFANNQVYSFKNISAGGAADSYEFTRYGEARPIMNVTIPASIAVNGNSSGTFGVSLDVIPSLGDLGSKAQGPIFLFGPEGTTFVPNLTLVIDYGLLTGSVTAIESLADSGYLQMKRCNSAGTGCANLAYTINKTAKTLTFSTDHFSTFAMYDGTTSSGGGSSSGGKSSGGTGGGSISGKISTVATKTEVVVPNQTQQEETSEVKPTQTEPKIIPPREETPSAPVNDEVQKESKSDIESQSSADVTKKKDDGLLGLALSSAGVVLGSIVILAVFIGGVWYYLKQRKK